MVIYIYMVTYITIKQRSSFARIIVGFPGDKHKGFLPIDTSKLSLIVPWEEYPANELGSN